jgi:putative transposase
MCERFSRDEILAFLRQAAAGTPVMDLCWNHCFSRSTFRVWKAKYGELIDTGSARLKRLEAENARLRKALAHHPGKGRPKRGRVAGVIPDPLGRGNSLSVIRTFA